MDISEDITGTLRAEAHHPPCVLEAAGFCTEHSAKARGIGYEEEISPTLRARTVPAAVALENHPADSRVKISGDGNVQALTSRMGTGGNNVPLVMKCVPFCKGTRPHSAEEAPDWKDGRVANTLNTFDRGESRCSELVVQASGVCSKESRYSVRRLTPTECARLQGFPDWWCSDLGTENPTDEEMAFWRKVFETRRRVMGTSSRPKTDAQIRKWLKAPHSDSAEYTMWGNGVALPCVRFVLAGIVWAAQNCDKSSAETLCRLLS